MPTPQYAVGINTDEISAIATVAGLKIIVENFNEISSETSVVWSAPQTVYSTLKPDEMYDPSFSVDGTALIFGEYIRATYKISTIPVVDSGEGKTTLHTSLERMSDPSYSADGYLVLFAEEKVRASDDKPYGVWRLKYMHADGTNVITILDDGNANLHPCWVTPSQIAFQWWSYTEPSTVFKIALIDLAGQGRIEMGEGEYPRVVSI